MVTVTTKEQQSTIKSTTVISDNGVQYSVWFNDEMRWDVFVSFGKDRAHRTGGPAFVRAARAQAEAVKSLLTHNLGGR